MALQTIVIRRKRARKKDGSAKFILKKSRVNIVSISQSGGGVVLNRYKSKSTTVRPKSIN